MFRVCVVGDYEPANETHVATTSALQHAAASVGRDVDVDWVSTIEITSVEAPRIQGADALLIAPGSPYGNMEGALLAITYARTRDVPLLGTCGGFQHLVVEYARNVLGVRDAEHAESSPDATSQVITPLTCSLVGQQMEVEVRRGTKAFAAYGRTQTVERYYCKFGLNPAYLAQLEHGGLVVSGVDADGEVRILEDPTLRFFMGTLFVPQTSSAAGKPHAVVLALIRAAAAGINASNEPIGQSVTY